VNEVLEEGDEGKVMPALQETLKGIAAHGGDEVIAPAAEFGNIAGHVGYEVE
jgi:hypothetical protein